MLSPVKILVNYAVLSLALVFLYRLEIVAVVIPAIDIIATPAIVTIAALPPLPPVRGRSRGRQLPRYQRLYLVGVTGWLAEAKLGILERKNIGIAVLPIGVT